MQNALFKYLPTITLIEIFSKLHITDIFKVFIAYDEYMEHVFNICLNDNEIFFNKFMMVDKYSILYYIYSEYMKYIKSIKYQLNKNNIFYIINDNLLWKVLYIKRISQSLKPTNIIPISGLAKVNSLNYNIYNFDNTFMYLKFCIVADSNYFTYFTNELDNYNNKVITNVYYNSTILFFTRIKNVSMILSILQIYDYLFKETKKVYYKRSIRHILKCIFQKDIIFNNMSIYFEKLYPILTEYSIVGDKYFKIEDMIYNYIIKYTKLGNSTIDDLYNLLNLLYDKYHDIYSKIIFNINNNLGYQYQYSDKKTKILHATNTKDIFIDIIKI